MVIKYFLCHQRQHCSHWVRVCWSGPPVLNFQTGWFLSSSSLHILQGCHVVVQVLLCLAGKWSRSCLLCIQIQWLGNFEVRPRSVVTMCSCPMLLCGRQWVVNAKEKKKSSFFLLLLSTLPILMQMGFLFFFCIWVFSYLPLRPEFQELSDYQKSWPSLAFMATQESFKTWVPEAWDL